MHEREAFNKNCHTFMASQYQSRSIKSKQEPNKLPRKKERRHFLAIPHKVDSGLPAHVVALCSKSSKCSDTNRMLSKRS